MICPHCGFDNLPGSEECSSCQQDLTQLDRPTAHDRFEKSIMEDPVSSLKPRKPIAVGLSATIQEAVEAMLGPGVGALLVVDNEGKLGGIFTERDLLTKVAVESAPLSQLAIQDYMTPSPETITEKDTLAFALHKMDIGGYRHLVITDASGRPTGIISVRDLLRHFTRLCNDS